jgi:hypothetical protein
MLLKKWAVTALTNGRGRFETCPYDEGVLGRMTVRMQ